MNGRPLLIFLTTRRVIKQVLVIFFGCHMTNIIKKETHSKIYIPTNTFFPSMSPTKDDSEAASETVEETPKTTTETDSTTDQEEHDPYYPPVITLPEVID